MSLSEQVSQRAKVAEAIDAFVEMATNHPSTPEGYYFEAEPSGSKYRIVMRYYGSASVHAFVDGDTGDLIKAASWKVPAKGKNGLAVRYNLLSEMDVVARNFVWSGSYLYNDWKRR